MTETTQDLRRLENGETGTEEANEEGGTTKMEAPETGTIAGGTRSFLVVDGSAAVRLATERMLKREGIAEEDIHFATSGKECLEIYRHHQPDVIIMAVDLPNDEGHEIADTILSRDPTARIVITSVRPVSEDERVRAAVAKGVFEVVQKPIRQQEISQLLRLMTDEAEGVDRIQ